MQRTARCAWLRPAAAFGLVALLVITSILVPASSASAALAGGGPAVAYRTLSTPELNAALKAAGLPALPSSVTLIGGGGSGPVPSHGMAVSIGGFGYGRTIETRTASGKVLTFEIGYGGAQLDYTRPVLGPLAVRAGIGVGFGGATLTVRHREATGVGDSLNNPTQSVLNRFILAVQPEVGVLVTLTPLIHLRAGVTYLYDTQVKGEWRDEGDNVLAGAPADSFSGLQYSLGLTFGVMF